MTQSPEPESRADSASSISATKHTGSINKFTTNKPTLSGCKNLYGTPGPVVRITRVRLKPRTRHANAPNGARTMTKIINTRIVNPRSTYSADSRPTGSYLSTISGIRTLGRSQGALLRFFCLG